MKKKQLQLLPRHDIPQGLREVVTNNLREWPGMSVEAMQYLQALKRINLSDQIQLTKDDFLLYLKLALFVEEVQTEINLKEYDMFDQTIFETTVKIKGVITKGFKIYIPTLLEEQPKVIINNNIEIEDIVTRKKYVLTVKKIRSDHVIVISEKEPMFVEQFKSNRKYNVRFVFNNFTYRCCHYALGLMHDFQLMPRMFPTEVETTSIKYTDEGVHWFNRNLYKNPEQRQAVINILNRSSRGSPYILYGPPGTGKTATVIEAICQAYQSNCKRILVCTPSNETADNIVKRLFQYIPKNVVHRMYGFSKDPEAVDKEILPYSNCVEYVEDGITKLEIIMFPVQSLPKIVICTLCSSIRFLLGGMFGREFSYIFIDEAGQAIEADAMIPLTLLSSSRPEHKGRFNGQIVLAGDPQQLGPVIFSPIAKKILENSILERLLKLEPYKRNNDKKYNPNYITKLVRNYRSHHHLIEISNEKFYDSELEAHADGSVCKFVGWDELPNRSFPMIFHEVRGWETKDFSPSPYNEAEIRTVLNYVDKLVGRKIGDTKIKPKDIGIVTPFTSQKLRLKAQLKDDGLEDIEVGTVQIFQGKEKEVIIVSTVRTEVFYGPGNKSHIGFLSDRKRFNVAITRAKSLLIVIGHPGALVVDDCWGHLIKYCDDNRGYTGYSFSIKYDAKGWKKRKNRKKEHQERMQKLHSFEQKVQNKELQNGYILKNAKAKQNNEVEDTCLNDMKTLNIRDARDTSENQQNKMTNVAENPMPSCSQIFNKKRTPRRVVTENNLNKSSDLVQNTSLVVIKNIAEKNINKSDSIPIECMSSESMLSDESVYYSCSDA